MRNLPKVPSYCSVGKIAQPVFSVISGHRLFHHLAGTSLHDLPNRRRRRRRLPIRAGIQLVLAAA